MNRSGRIGIVTIGTVPALVPKVIAAHIDGYLNLEATILKPMQSPMYALDERRLQFDAGMILRKLESMPVAGAAKIVGILNVDIFLPVFTHVFGESRQQGRAALVSLFRLAEAPLEKGRPPPELLERAAKVALHEMGHLFGLEHCEVPACLMHFSGNLTDLDQTVFTLCRYCARFFKDARKQALGYGRDGMTP